MSGERCRGRKPKPRAFRRCARLGREGRRNHASGRRRPEARRRPADGRSFADRARGDVEFLVEHALLVTGQAAAVLSRHVGRLLADHVEPAMQRGALRRRIVAGVHTRVDSVTQVIDAALDLLHPLIADHLRTGARRGRRTRRRDHTCRERRDEDAACRRADQPLHCNSPDCRCRTGKWTNGSGRH
ncbi:hypothetical protein X997_5538 [Burkholderia pseudomallei A79C]|nr:hypothetical protein X997_5538 [Burkholderia pseudomallei A79C]